MIGCGDSDIVTFMHSGVPRIVAYFSRMLPRLGVSGKPEAPPRFLDGRRGRADVPLGVFDDGSWPSSVTPFHPLLKFGSEVSMTGVAVVSRRPASQSHHETLRLAHVTLPIDQ